MGAVEATVSPQKDNKSLPEIRGPRMISVCSANGLEGNPFSAGIVIRRQNLTSEDVRF